MIVTEPLELHHLRRMNLAAQQNGVPIVRLLRSRRRCEAYFQSKMRMRSSTLRNRLRSMEKSSCWVVGPSSVEPV